MSAKDFHARLEAIVDQASFPEYPRDMRKAFIELGQIGDLDRLLDLAKDSQLSADCRPLVFWLLRRLEDRAALPELIEGLNTSGPLARAEAARGIGLFEGAEAVSALFFEDEDLEVRISAAYALGLIGDPDGQAPLLEVLGNPNEPEMLRGMAAEALHSFGNQGAVAVLRNTLRDASPEVRFWSAYSLGQLYRSTDFGNTEEVLRDLAEIAQTDNAKSHNGDRRAAKRRRPSTKSVNGATTRIAN